MNRSKDLRDLFRKSLKRKATEVTTYRASDYRRHGAYESEINFVDKIKVYFYEWSDVTRVPRTFDDLGSLEDYLKACGMYLQLYQRDIINNCGTVYMTCYKGSKELNVRGSYGKLLDSMNEHDRLSKQIEESKKEKESTTSTVGGRPSDPSMDIFKGSNPFYGGTKTVDSPSGIQRPVMVEPEGRWQEEAPYSNFWY